MKYLKMVLIPLIMAAIVLIYYWLLAVGGEVLVGVSTLVFVPLVLSLFWLDLKDLKEQKDGLLAGFLLMGITVVGTFFIVIFANWPWSIVQVPDPSNGALGMMTPYFRLCATVFNWYALVGFVLGSAIGGLTIAWMNKNKNS